jgi:hypothetical protein
MNGTILGALIALGLILYYPTSCAFWPYARCWRCKGDGKFTAWWGKAFRLCGRCDGTGRRLRIGRRIYNHFHRLRRESR